MTSMLTGVDRKLRWSDFTPVAAGPAGTPAGAVAETIPGSTATGGAPQNIAAQGLAPIFEIPDNIVMNVFIKNTSWRLNSVSNWSGPDQVWLIKHEQGHYDIHALMVRDFFFRLRAMVGTPFSSVAAVNAAIVAHRNATVGRVPALQQDYDNDTANSRNGSEQWTWWCAIQRASQLHRLPLVAGPDGRYLRLELADALSAAGLA